MDGFFVDAPGAITESTVNRCEGSTHGDEFQNGATNGGNTRLDPEIAQTSVSPAIIMDNKKPPLSSQSGRRKSGGSTQLRSPVVKRPSTAPVALQGWLHKQGSEGLMLWKKRWFVLSEYCLFYYKGPEEEKLLGSILLPSYKISLCTADDKVYRKFAFKAEHANMRTYYFAAETRELMNQWINALSMASLLQEGSKVPPQDVGCAVPATAVVKQNSDFAFQGYNSCSGPVTIQPTSQDRNFQEGGGNVNGWSSLNPSSPYQPLYANAPPKPKRLNNEGQYGGSSPEASPSRRDDSENILYAGRRRFQENVTPVRQQDYNYNPYQSGYSPGSVLDSDSNVRPMPHSGDALMERIPDNVAWKSPSYPANGQRREEVNSNYSDMFKANTYNLGTALRPEGPNFLPYGNNAANYLSPNYQHPNQYYQSYQQASQTPFDASDQDLDYGRNNQVRRRQPPRPHSADFLDYDAKKFYSGKKHVETRIAEKSTGQLDQYNSARPPRPKSSLDIVHSNDGYYWSEERYAEKMRQSAMYLQNTLPQRSQSSRANTPIARQPNDSSNATDGKITNNEQVLANMKQKILTEISRDQTSSPRGRNLRRWSEHQNRNDSSFMRSASARLPKMKLQDEESDEVQAYTGGEDFTEGRKEESMKRLLEWKQRMLQSPLTRKSSGSSTRGVAQNDLSKSYKQQVLKELEKQEAKTREELGKRKMQNRMSDGRLSAILSSDRYYNYSSDDEENEKNSEERIRRTSQSRKSSRKEREEGKGKKPVQGKSVNFASPNYENVSQTIHESANGRFTCFPSDRLHGQDLTEPDEQSPLKHRKTDKKQEQGTKTLSTGVDETVDDGLKTHGESSRRENPSYTHSDYKFHTSKKTSWDEKIDESKLIKEFSYQYIKDPKPHEKKTTAGFAEGIDVPPENIVKSRIKQLQLLDPESGTNEGIIKEPLKVSSPNYYLNEAHISHLKSTEEPDKFSEKRKPDKHKSKLETPGPGTPEKQQKSVKDLLADFERKSQLAQEREEHEKSFDEMPGKRCVFSDTETLLYDTSSDTEDKKREPDPSILNTLRKAESRRVADELTEEEDRDEEVAAALSRRDRSFASGRESSRKRDGEFSHRGKRSLPKSVDLVTSECSPSSEMESIITPGCLRSTLTESAATLDNSDSTCSTPTIERIKDNLAKTLPTENLNKKMEELAKEEENCEGHYMPMTPSRRVSAPPSDKSRSNSSLHSFLFGADPEETYVEMSENGGPALLLEPNKSALSKIRKTYSDPEAPRYCEVTGNNSNNHYDFLYHHHSSGVIREPEYMEVNTLLEILKEQDEKLKEHKNAMGGKLTGGTSGDDFAPPTPPRSALPDILNSSAGQQTTKSDSSDADDESSKDLDSLDIPRHPRFSLSDTFRPASYYLGGAMSDRDRNMMRLRNSSENHDSSDSDLVSPPPIPTSPPPLDDLDTSLETERSLDMRPQNPVKLKGAAGGVKETEKKLWDTSGDNVEETRKKKRRPVSEDMLDTLEEAEPFFFEKPLVFSELDSIGNRNGLALDEDLNDINLDQYLEDLQLNSSMNAQLYSKHFGDNIYKGTEKEMKKNLMTKDCMNKVNPIEKSLLKISYPSEQSKREEEEEEEDDDSALHERTKSMEEVQYENLQTLFPPPPPELYESSNEQSDRESSLAMYRNVAFPEVPPPDNYCDVYESTEKPKICFDPNTLEHQNEELDNVSSPPKTSTSFENQGAPYYYSDIIKNEDGDFGSSNSERSTSVLRNGHRYQPLNNQRDHIQETNQCTKRNDIGRKVNPISQNYLSSSAQPTNDLNDVQKITAELRTTSAHFMGAADKSGTVDARNIYESDTLQRRKGGAVQGDEGRPTTPDMHHPQGVARNLYPQGLRDKSATGVYLSNFQNGKFSSGPQTRSRSVEGLLNDPNRLGEDERTENLARLPASSNPPTLVNPIRNHSCEGEDFWDKDALWRENLRKVSLRHTRSLDNLDDDVSWNTTQRLSAAERSETADKFPSGRRSVDHLSATGGPVQKTSPVCPTGRRSADHFSKNKLTRNVTYVNDVVRRNKSVDLTREYEEDYREGRLRPRKKEKEMKTVVELTDSGVLDCDDGVHYEKLVRTGKQTVRREESLGCGCDWDKQRGDTFQRTQPVGKEVAPNDKSTSSYGENTATGSSEGPLNESLKLEPLDREKLRQWDLMSSGPVEQPEERKMDQPEVKDSNVKKLMDPVSEPDIGEYVVVERREPEARPLELAPPLQASGSGSLMREPLLSSSAASTLPLPAATGSKAQKASVLATASPIRDVLSKEDNLGKQKLSQTGRSLPDFIDRSDYYDREADFPGTSAAFRDRGDATTYVDKRGDLSGGEEMMMTTPERAGRPMAEGNAFFDQYQNRLYGGYHRGDVSNNRLTVSPSVSVHTYGRSVESPEGRGYPGKENLVKRKVSTSPWGLDVSAGELLGRTHEELVLLLIQLRRQSASVCKAMECCHIEIEEQARLAELDTPKRMEHIRKLDKLKKHLLELEKQYEKGKPLVNLVDNMVKLGSLYKGNSHVYNGTMGLEHSPTVREKLEFNQKVQEQRLLAEERRDWDRLSSDHGQLQAKVQQLYKLDRLLQEESGTLHILQQDKELLEKALGGLRHKLQVNRSNPVEADRCRKQQKLIEKELSRVRLLLAHNSKKLEETVAENARLEQELVILRQKLQASRVSSRSSVPLLAESATMSTTAALEAELRRVQQLVGDLQRQRHELSAQVKQLTEKSDTLVQQIRPGPTGVAGAGPIPGKKKSSATWLETDLDLLITQDVGIETQVTSPQLQQQPVVLSNSRSTTPIYINTDTSKKGDFVTESVNSPTDDSKNRAKTSVPPAEETQAKASYCTPVELSEADERMKRFYGIIPREKQEIKTVRIVKRESERRQRDRDRSGNIGIPVGNMAVAKRVSVIEENDAYGLGRVEEESYDAFHNSPGYGENGSDQKATEYRVSEETPDPYINFHPTNPFLPQNLAANNGDDVFMVDMDPLGKRSLSLPRGFGKNGMGQPQQQIHHQALSKYDSNPALRSLYSKRNRVRFENHSQDGSGCESGSNSPRNDQSTASRPYNSYLSNPGGEYLIGRPKSKLLDSSQSYEGCSPTAPFVTRPLRPSDPDPDTMPGRKGKNSPDNSRSLTAREQLFGSGFHVNEESSPQLSPVYQSEAAREIIMEMSNISDRRGPGVVSGGPNRRQIRKEKRRHHTVSNIRHVTESDSNLSKMGSARSRDDLDMERALRPRMNAPDVVRSTMNHKDLKYNESTIDSILGTPNKIVIPERYIPEQEQLTVEEQMQRSRKAESIRKMLSETTALSTPDLSTEGLEEERKSCTLRKKVEEEKKQREHLLELNQILAQQVMEKSKLVAVKAMASLPLEGKETNFEEGDSSPVQPLPIYQQRENFYS